jgi:hypothetical protein
MDVQPLNAARQILHQTLPDFLHRRNVQACGLGYKVSNGRQLDTLSLIVSVTQKIPASQLAPEDLIPKEVQGLLTDVVATGMFHAFDLLDPRARRRPAQPGISVGHYRITAGTIGLIVYRENTPLILSNNHVLANSNNALEGDPIYQPGPADGGTSNDRIATLSDYMPIDFGETSSDCSIVNTMARVLNNLARLTGSSHRLQAIKVTPGINTMDAALAMPDDPDLVKSEILGVGLVNEAGEPVLGQRVQKMGRTTGLTQGVITQTDVTVKVNYGGRVANFTDQIFADVMSSPGDSGSSILDMENRAVGLLFAGSETVTILTPLQHILNHFGVTVFPNV